MNNNEDFWGDIFRWALTFLVFAFYTANVFFNFRGNWDFLTTFDYWSTTISSTTLAFFLRYLWSLKGLERAYKVNNFINEKEEGKSSLIAKVNANNLNDELETYIDELNDKKKTEAYTNLVDRKIKKYTRKSLNPFRKLLFKKWKKESEWLNSDDFNIDIVKVTYYEYDINDVLTSYYRNKGGKKNKRSTLNSKVLKSYRTNIFTFFTFAVLGGVELFKNNTNLESILLLLGKFIMFGINMYSGYNLGKEFIDVDYNDDLTEDYNLLKTFLKMKDVQ